ncbi:hypothetical protein BIT28_16100 [Photobacterium proteolyticum]|uniref:Uncharacterized protein n=2 Tax=Photobacterium proteolyticum TaxID=1903952 RepID=A0A1Q9H298_9GAMM|nr:hypothetical protein BIT28_16100 [Photobacterium proteolyticum]
MNVSSLSLDKEDLRRFCDILQERANAAAEIEVGLFEQNNQTDDQYAENIKTLRESFLLRVTIAGKDGEELWGPIDEVFCSVNYPEQVKSLYVDSESTLRYAHNYYPHNTFKIFFDFSKPRVFDLSLLPSTGTPNESNVEVNGYDATWVNGVFSEIKKFLDNRSSKMSFVHNHSVYDVLLWILGFPLSFWVCSKLSSTIEEAVVDNAFINSALYLYTFVATLFIFRVLFHYLRWVCPLVEYRCKGNLMLAHRALFSILSVGWFGQFLYDLAKWIIKT